MAFSIEGLAALALIVLGEEMLEASVIIQALRSDPGSRAARSASAPG